MDGEEHELNGYKPQIVPATAVRRLMLFTGTDGHPRCPMQLLHDKRRAWAQRVFEGQSHAQAQWLLGKLCIRVVPKEIERRGEAGDDMVKQWEEGIMRFMDTRALSQDTNNPEDEPLAFYHCPLSGVGVGGKNRDRDREGPSVRTPEHQEYL